MVIDETFQIRMLRLWNNKEYDTLKKELFKFRAKHYDKLSRIEDKVLIDYRMAYLEYVQKNVERANYYFDILKSIFDDEENRKCMEYDYYKYRWLYVNNNFDYLNDEDKLKTMIDVYNYCKINDLNDLTIVALENISRINGNEEEILNNLKNLLLSDNIRDYILVESILEDCECISHNLYIRALDIIEKFNKVNIGII